MIKPSVDVPTTYHPAKQNEGVRNSQGTPETPDEYSVLCLQLLHAWEKPHTQPYSSSVTISEVDGMKTN